MPMSNSGYQWRPNDNSSLTNHRYDLEAEKWVNAVNHAQHRSRGATLKGISGDIGAIFTFLSLPLLLIGWVILIPVWLIREVFKYNIKIFPGDEATGPIVSDSEKFRAEIEDIKRRYPPREKRKKTWDELTEEQKRLVIFTREQTAKSKALVGGNSGRDSLFP